VAARESVAAKARRLAQQKCYLAAARSLYKHVQNDPSNTQATEELRVGMTNLNVARPYFIPMDTSKKPSRTRASFVEPPKPKVQEVIPAEVDDEWRKAADYKEFELYWKEVAPELKELMKREPPENLQVLRDTCWKLFPNIKAMFLYYATRDAGLYAKLSKSKVDMDVWTAKRGANSKVSMIKTVSALEFSEFLRDTDLVTKKGGRTSILKADAELIFTRVNWERDEDGGQAQDDTNPDREMTGHEWLHAIIRIAHKLPLFKGLPTLHERVKHCVQKIMLPKAKRVDMSEFQDRFAAAQVQDVLMRSEFLLRSLFNLFAASETDEQEELSLMDSQELVTLCRRLSIINEQCPQEVILTSHVLAQRSEDGSSEDISLQYEEFVWALCRIADLWVPDKYLKLSRKVKSLIEHIEQHKHLLNTDEAAVEDSWSGGSLRPEMMDRLDVMDLPDDLPSVSEK